MAGLWEWANTPELQAMTLVLGGLPKFRQWHLGATFVPLASYVFYAEIAITLSVVWENFGGSWHWSEADGPTCRGNNGERWLNSDLAF